ncbi:cold-responsive protein kinase 1 [Selaginella moellendorffii]|uniref:cold-responsive protein kinase 1 n=1 Tax=Selaginella moellendorffii TaxID=88036 RepID=UPI000D1C611F|nr:cold-responsive protein kinase 1 [Selaginella moellendorffii]|eukprot:XP_024518200.1 cold-responsive protein kinase 1 [Selaginella moellendorffii]
MRGLPIATILFCVFILVPRSSSQPPTDSLPNVIYYNTMSFSPGSAFERNLDAALQSVISSSRSSPSAALGASPDVAYARGECYNNLSPQDCVLCLGMANQTIRGQAPRTIGARLFSNSSDYSCYLRYENYDFLGGVTPRIPEGTIENAPAAPLLRNAAQASFPLGIVVGVLAGVLVTLVGIFVFFCLRRRRSLRIRRKFHLDTFDLPVIDGISNFTYHELETATKGFSDINKLGRGAFGTVFKGVLKDGSEVAVKQLDLHSKQGQREFVNELSIITSIQHKNLAKLRGYCLDRDDRILVYEFLENKSLDQLLFESATGILLDWPTRFQIVLGVANGLAYLHEGSQKQIIHRDIKASNILLDHRLHPKISDFGISKLFNQEKGFTSTVIAGTMGYLAPEYVLGGLLTVKADVYSFGVLTLEIVSGQRCSDRKDGRLLVHSAWILHENSSELEIADQRLDLEHNSEEILRVIQVALACTHENSASRPSMGDAVAMLSGYKQVIIAPRSHGAYLDYLSSNDTDSSRLLTTSNTFEPGTSFSIESRP